VNHIRQVKDWLVRRVTVAEAEAANVTHLLEPGLDPAPFDRANARWRNLVAQASDGDELWQFGSPQDTWKRLAGRTGYAIMRDGEPVTVAITFLS
jgi:hypothetical protein